MKYAVKHKVADRIVEDGRFDTYEDAEIYCDTMNENPKMSCWIEQVEEQP